jgi:hypothetical protein
MKPWHVNTRYLLTVHLSNKVRFISPGDTETLPEGTEAPLGMHTLRIQEAGSVTLSAEDVQRATRDSASTPPPQAFTSILTLILM